MPRPPKEPTTERVLALMDPDGCYVVADIMDEVSEADVSRWTIRNRLTELVESGEVERIEHANGTVTFHRL